MDFTKKKLQQEFDDKLETEQQGKRHLERRASSFFILNHCTNQVLFPCYHRLVGGFIKVITMVCTELS